MQKTVELRRDRAESCLVLSFVTAINVPIFLYLEEVLSPEMLLSIVSSEGQLALSPRSISDHNVFLRLADIYVTH